MKETIRLGLILFAITVVSGGILAGSNELTKEKIAQIEMESSLGAITEIFNPGDTFEEIEESKLEEIIAEMPSVLEVLEVYTGDSISGYVIKTIGSGYGGDLVIATGISTEGEVVGIRLLEHSETPGFGANAEKPEYTDQFIGKSVDEEITIEGLSGATKTDTTVRAEVNEAREVFNAHFAN